MVKYSGADPESFLSVGQRSIHCHQRVVKTAQRIIAQFPSRHRMLRCFDSGREPAEPQDVDALQTLRETKRSVLGLAGLHGSQQALGRRSVGEQEMFEYL